MFNKSSDSNDDFLTDLSLLAKSTKDNNSQSYLNAGLFPGISEKKNCQKRKSSGSSSKVKHIKKGFQDYPDDELYLPEDEDDDSAKYVMFSQDTSDYSYINPLLDSTGSVNVSNANSSEIPNSLEHKHQFKKNIEEPSYYIWQPNDHSNFQQSLHNVKTSDPNMQYSNEHNSRKSINFCCSMDSHANFSNDKNEINNISTESHKYNLESSTSHLQFKTMFLAKDCITNHHKTCKEDVNVNYDSNHNSNLNQTPSYLRYLQQQSQLRCSQVLENIYGRKNLHSSAKCSTALKENGNNAFLRRYNFESSNYKIPEPTNSITLLDKEDLCKTAFQSPKVTLHPSTYIEKSYYKNDLPHECLKKNELYENRTVTSTLSNSYDNLSDCDASVTSNSPLTPTPPKRFQRNSYPFAKKAGPSGFKIPSFSPHQRFESSLLKYNLQKLFSQDATEKVIDTHCHLDFLFKKECYKGTFCEYIEKKNGEFLPCFAGCVANFIDPVFFSKRCNWENLLEEKNVWASFGVHPHFSTRYDEAIEEILLEALKHERVVAVGEIGLDYSTKNNCNKAVQQEVFRRQLTIAVKHNKPLVIHCRDAQEDCLRILAECVPQETKIHRHCFTGSWNEAQEWLNKFPNLFLGFTSLVTFRNARHLHEVVRLTPVNRILFETDAPYFVPSQVQDEVLKGKQDRKFSHPGMVIHVAAQIAVIKGIKDFPKFLASVRKNTKTMYNI